VTARENRNRNVEDGEGTVRGKTRLSDNAEPFEEENRTTAGKNRTAT